MIDLNTNGALGVIQLPSGTAVPATAFYKAGIAYYATGEVYVVPITGSVPATAEYTSGKAITPDGALYVKATTPSTYNAGVPLTADGAVCVTALGATVSGQFIPQIGYVTGGKVCIAGPQVLVDGNTVANYVRGIGQTNDGAGLCSAWANQIGAAGSLTAATTARPTIQADGSLLFDGAGNLMQAAFPLIQPESIYLVVKQISWTFSDYVLDGNNPDSAAIVERSVTPNIFAYAGTPSSENANLTVGTYGVVTVVFNGANSLLQVNGTAAITGNFGAAAAAGITLACQAGGAISGTCANIQVKEVIVRNVADSAATQALIQAYLKSIYGTP